MSDTHSQNLPSTEPTAKHHDDPSFLDRLVANKVCKTCGGTGKKKDAVWNYTSRLLSQCADCRGSGRDLNPSHPFLGRIVCWLKRKHTYWITETMMSDTAVYSPCLRCGRGHVPLFGWPSTTLRPEPKRGFISRFLFKRDLKGTEFLQFALCGLLLVVALCQFAVAILKIYLIFHPQP